MPELTFDAWKCRPCADEEQQCAVAAPSYDVKEDLIYKVAFQGCGWRACTNYFSCGPMKSGPLFGPEGHAERSSVWTHALSALLVAVYIAVREGVSLPPSQSENLSNTLQRIALCCFVVTLSTSAVYHVVSASPVWSGIGRVGDYSGIYLSLSAATVASLSITARNLDGLSWQATFDVPFAAFLLATFFALRRAVLQPADTRKRYCANGCSLGLARMTNVDLEHTAFRSAGGLLLAMSWVMCVSNAFNTLDSYAAWVFLLSQATGTAVLIFGMVFDRVLSLPDALFLKLKNSRDLKYPAACLASQSLGCVFHSHAVWHLLAFMSILISTAGTEWLLAGL